jgi:hypothetical protein
MLPYVTFVWTSRTAVHASDARRGDLVAEDAVD